jgi:uncharacterized DUF497 family protein
MSALHFEWDDEKAAANVRKHGIGFEEAKSVFRDERAKLIGDPDHSEVVKFSQLHRPEHVKVT